MLNTLAMILLSLHAMGGRFEMRQRPAPVVGEQHDTLETIAAKIAANPEAPWLHYRKCQLLYMAGMEQAAVDYAAVAMEKFIAAGDDTPGMYLGAFNTDEHQIIVVYNMTPAERAKNKMWIVRPYSFVVRTLDDPPKFVKKIDWEFNYIGGRPVTAAVGEMVPTGHVNYGMLPVESDFATVKAKVLATLKKTIVTAATIRGEKPEDGKVEIYVDGIIEALMEEKRAEAETEEKKW